jgi:hypothetical protein
MKREAPPAPRQRALPPAPLKNRKFSRLRRSRKAINGQREEAISLARRRIFARGYRFKAVRRAASIGARSWPRPSIW